MKIVIAALAICATASAAAFTAVAQAPARPATVVAFSDLGR